MTEHPNYAPSVENLQRYLRQLSYGDERITSPPVDGVFASQTEQSLRDFQRSRGIAETGRANKDTWDLLYTAYRASLAENSPPRPMDVFPRTPPKYRLKQGVRSYVVTAVQYMLQELQVIYGGLGGVRASGEYDAATADAIRSFQAQNRLTVTGEVDLLTWNLLADQYNLIFGQIEDQ